MHLLKNTLFYTLLLAATSLAACSDDDDNGAGNGGDGKKYFDLPYAYGVYYHTYWGEKAGDYYLVLTDKDLDDENGQPYQHRIDIDFLSVLTDDPDHARPLDGDYVIGEVDSDRPGIMIEGFLSFDPVMGQPGMYGTFWNRPDDEEGTSTAVPIVSGKMNIKTAGDITTIRAELVDRNDSTLRVSYRGKLDFENHANESYQGDSRLVADYAMDSVEPVASMRRMTDECTSAYDRWDLHFYEKKCYQTQGAEGFYIWFRLVTAPGQRYLPAGTYEVTSAPAPGFLPGERAETPSGSYQAVNTWFYAGRTPHAPLTNGTLTVKTTDGTHYEISLSMGDDHPFPYHVTGAFSGTVKML